MLGLSHEAIIKLRPPSSGAIQQQEDWQPPTVSWLRSNWRVTHSTDAPSRYHRHKNVRIDLSSTPNDETSYSVELSHQDTQTLSIESTTSTLTSSGFSEENKTASRFKFSGPPRAEWEVLAWGKEGQLEEWMIPETNGMISDTSGEWRPDWRNSYAVVLIGTADGAEECAVEVWDDGAEFTPLSGETIGKIKDALKGVGVEGELHPVLVDGGRKQDDQEKWKAAQGPVCTDIILDEEEPKSKWCCL
ncbi:hypothetical protein B0T14DRAFT_565226 [Immersiella caudata]|uniref:Uncharacterized protein n=1 Tax=Immersiella caudata TaxID=314043 RepID=A0AA39WYC9_9PEZI|nr:hypothetical protein B0T14DRAFT_565226 [Immersiella caudata]